MVYTVIAPSFPPRAACADGQSTHVVESTHALTRVTSRPVRVLALRLGDEVPSEREGDVLIERLAPATPIAGPFQLYAPETFVPTMTGFAADVVDRVPAGTVCFVHGYELAKVATALRRRGVHVVGVSHYLLAQETAHYLAAVRDPLRRAAMPPALAASAALVPPMLYTLARRSLASMAGRAGGLVGHLATKLAFEAEFMHAAHRIVGVSHTFARTIANAYPGTRAHGCLAGSPPRAATSGLGSSDGLHVVAIGRPTPQKAWDVLARGLRWLEDERPAIADRVRVTLIGGGGAEGVHSEYARSVLAQFGDLRRVRVATPGRLDRAGVIAALDQADVLAHPSEYEPFGLVLLEAMSRGCPVLAAEADGPIDVLSGTDAGWLVPRTAWPDQGRVWGEWLAWLATRPSRAMRASREAAWARAEAFRWEHTAADLAHAGDLALHRP